MWNILIEILKKKKVREITSYFRKLLDDAEEKFGDLTVEEALEKVKEGRK